MTPQLTPDELESRAWNLYQRGQSHHLDMGGERYELIVAGKTVAWAEKGGAA